MKKSVFLLAITMFIVTLGVVSCSKNDYLVPATQKGTSKTHYNPPKVDDLNAYLLDFKQKLQSRDNNGTMELDEAAWHLSSIANIDLGDVVSSYDNFLYDTLYYNIPVENGKVCLSDLNNVYSQAINDISRLVNNLSQENKHIRFIGTDISDDGTVAMSILVSYGWTDHQWYFPDLWTLVSTLSPYFDYDYASNLSVFTDTLETVLNDLVAFHPVADSIKVNFVIGNTVVFYFRDYEDPYGSEFVGNSRLLAYEVLPDAFRQDDCFYCFDSYAGLAVDSCWSGVNHYQIIDFNINTLDEFVGPTIRHHELTVRYGYALHPEPIVPPHH